MYENTPAHSPKKKKQKKFLGKVFELLKNTVNFGETGSLLVPAGARDTSGPGYTALGQSPVGAAGTDFPASPG